MSVRSLLITAPEPDLVKVQFSIAAVCNFIDRRGQTTRWTVFDEDFDYAVGKCKQHDATCQEILRPTGPEGETYALLHQGKSERWLPPKTNT